MNWIPLTTLAQLEDIINANTTAVIFKHSTRCVVSNMARRNLELDKNLMPDNVNFYFLDLIAHRDISNQIASTWNVRHESPQILIVEGNTCKYNASHSEIEMQDIIAHL